MNVETIKSGKCPVCGSNEVYDNREKNPIGHRGFISVSAMYSFNVEAFVCLNCGYFKEFIKDADLNSDKIKDKIKEKWNKTDGQL